MWLDQGRISSQNFAVVMTTPTASDRPRGSHADLSVSALGGLAATVIGLGVLVLGIPVGPGAAAA
jgi:hypothetical protein